LDDAVTTIVKNPEPEVAVQPAPEPELTIEQKISKMGINTWQTDSN
jgi:hypothetical protein